MRSLSGPRLAIWRRLAPPHHFNPHVDRPQQLVGQQLGRLPLELGPALTLRRPTGQAALAGVRNGELVAAVAEPVEPVASAECRADLLGRFFREMRRGVR